MYSKIFILLVDDKQVLYGIVSYSIGCGITEPPGVPEPPGAVYTNVFSQVEFIKDILVRIIFVYTSKYFGHKSNGLHKCLLCT